jgi:hypothetical protein
LSQKTKNKKRADRLEQVDALTFSDEAAKLLTFVEHQGALFLFMLN